MPCGTRTHLIASSHTLHASFHTLLPNYFPRNKHEVIYGKFSPTSWCPLPPATRSYYLLHIMQAFHLAHPVRSSSSPPATSTPMSLSHSLEWHMLIRPFKEIANRLAHFWSYLSINLSANLPSPLRLSLWDFLPGRGRGCYRRYRSVAEEQKWWDESARIRAFFAPSDARYDGRRRAKMVSAPECFSPIPLIMSYVPRLLPQYRDPCPLDDAATECELTASVYRKWHRLVFPKEVCPCCPTSGECQIDEP